MTYAYWADLNDPLMSWGKCPFLFSQIFFARSIILLVVGGPLWYHLNMVGPIEKIAMQANLYYYAGSSIKISGWSGFRFSVRFPVFVLIMVASK